MRDPDEIRKTVEYRALLGASARLGQDPLQVQGPGGNTSLKRGGAMWIKASGTWLASAETDDIMVPVDAQAMREAAEAGDPAAEEPARFTLDDANRCGRRASIETPVHAVIPRPVVLHTHCVATLAVAIRADAEAVVASRLAGLNAAFVPYCKPGAALARAIRARLRPETRIVVLGNHGLIVCGDSVAEAESLLRDTSRRLAPTLPAAGADVEAAFSDRLAPLGWMPAPGAETQAIATDPVRLAFAAGRTLYPDHLVFLGPGVPVAPAGSEPSVAADPEPRRHLVVLRGEGVAIRAGASRPMLALARCLGDVLARVDPGAPLVRLRESEEGELLDWDAEKLRQALNRPETSSP